MPSARRPSRTILRFDAIDRRFDRVEADIVVLTADVATLKADVATLKTDVATLKTDVATLKTDVATLKTDVATLKTDVATLKTDVATLKTDVADMRRHMGVLHEDVLSRIAGIREGMDDTVSLRAEMRAGFAEIRDLIRNHAIPGEAADRQFAATLTDHERRIRILERPKPPRRKAS